MGLFDLGDDIRFVQKFNCSLAQARALAQDVLDSYAPLGYDVDVEDTGDPAEARAIVRDGKGSEIRVEIDMSDDGRQTELDIRLAGVVFVGGVKGMMATDGIVQRVALEQLESFVRQRFDGVTREADAPEADAPEAAKAAEGRRAGNGSEPEYEEEPKYAEEENAEYEEEADEEEEEEAAYEEQEPAAEEEEEDEELDQPADAEPDEEPEIAAGPKGSSYEDTVNRLGREGFDDASEAEKEKAVNEAIQVCSIAAAAVTIQPIPLVDLALVTPIQIAMVQLIGSIRGHKLSPATVVEFIGTFGASMVTRNLVLALTKLIPVAGWAVSVPTAYAMTFALGKVTDEYFKSGRKGSPSELKAMFKDVYDSAFSEKSAEAKDNASLKDKLTQLVEAFDAGLISEEEFTRKKEDVLRKL